MDKVNQLVAKYEDLAVEYDELVERVEFLKIKLWRRDNLNAYRTWLQGPGRFWKRGLTTIRPACPVMGWRDKDIQILLKYGTLDDIMEIE